MLLVCAHTVMVREEKYSNEDGLRCREQPPLIAVAYLRVDSCKNVLFEMR